MKLPWRILASIAAVLLLVGALACFLWINPASRAIALNLLPALYPPESKALGQVVIDNYHEYRANAARWSGVYFSCLFGAALLSALAGLVLKLELLQAWPRFRNDFAATAAMIAALLITLSTSGDFQRKWQANRIAAAAMENLAYELVNAKSTAEREAVIAEIQAINDARNKGIVGEQATGRPRESSRSQVPAASAGAGDATHATRN